MRNYILTYHPYPTYYSKSQAERAEDGMTYCRKVDPMIFCEWVLDNMFKILYPYNTTPTLPIA